MNVKTKLHASRSERLADVILRDLRDARLGDRVDSVRTIATRHGISINTVRAALEQLQAKGWVSIRHGSGCYVNRPAPSAGRHIALLSEYNLLLSPRGSAFYPNVMNELRLFMQTKGQSSRLYIGHVMADNPASNTETCSDLLEDIALDRISGIAALATLLDYTGAKQADAKGIPVVGMSGSRHRFNGTVDPNFADAIQGALHELVTKGCRRPAFIGWDKGSCATFNTVVAGMGLTPTPSRTRISLHPAELGAGWSDFREIWAAGEIKPDSVIFGDDVLFLDALPAIQSIGVRIPSALEIVVLANKGLSLPRPFPYTRLDCDPAEVARKMGTLLLQLIAGEEPPQRQITVPYRPADDKNIFRPSRRRTLNSNPDPDTLNRTAYSLTEKD